MKRIFIACVLFILLSVPTQAQETRIYLPIIFKSVGCKMSFPTTGILDDFNRANEGPPPSANWTNIANGLKVVSNSCAGDVAAPDGNASYWNVSTFGNTEAYFTITDIGANGDATYVMARLNAEVDGYGILWVRDDIGGDELSLLRFDDGAETVIAGPIIQDVSNGDGIGIRCDENAITGWYKSSGGDYVNSLTAVDSAYTSGYIGATITGADVRIGNFGGGTYAGSGGSSSSVTLEPECKKNSMNNNWSFIQPVESTNYVLNPSAEAASNYSSLAGSTVTRSSTYQKYGRYSYRVQTGANGQGLSLTLSTLTNSAHYVTARIRGQLPNNPRFIIGTGLKTPVYLEKIDDNWNLYGVQFNASETNGRTELRIIQQGNGIGDFYVDGVQVEPLAYWTTYIDGTQEGCAWNGTEHASTSTRSGLSLAGGQVKDFYEDYSFLVEKIIGGGAPSQNVNVDDYAILPGGELNSIKILPRDMSIVGKFIADNELELHDKQQALHLALSSENYPNNQSFKLRFNGARVQKEIEVNYKGGLEGELNAIYQDRIVSGDSDWELLYKWIEKASIQFQATDPYWYETGESAANLDGNDSATFYIVAARLKSTGQWSNLGPPSGAGDQVFAIVEDSNYVYFGGGFSNFNGIANADSIVRYNKQDGTWSAMGTGGDAAVYALAIGPDGTVYAGGPFTSMGGVANTSKIARWNPVSETWSAMGTGMNDYVAAITVSSTGLVYAAGNFTSPATRIAKWNGVGWSALTTGLNGVGLSLSRGSGESIFVGGLFTTAGGVTVNYIAQWSGTAWSALGGGMSAGQVSALAFNENSQLLYAGGNFVQAGGVNVNDIAVWNGTSWSALGSGTDGGDVYALGVGQDGVLYASGGWTTVSGVSSSRIARWNGFAWSHFDIELPTATTIVYAIYPSKYADPVVSQKYDLYLGFDTSGTGYFAGKVSVTNEGNALAFPQIIFKRTGGTSITIETLKNETTGKELLFDYDLLDGERLTIDLTPTKKSIISNYFGSRLDAILANSDFGIWALRPGSNDVTSFTADNFALYPSSLDAYLLWKDKYKSYN